MDMIRYEARPEQSLFEDIFPMTRWFDDTLCRGPRRTNPGRSRSRPPEP